VNITIDPEFQSLIPPLSAEERAELERNLVAWGGAREPLVTWSGLLLDGHNRFEICTRLDLFMEERIATKDVVDRDTAIIWIGKNQLGRRNLSSITRIELAIKVTEATARRAKANQAHGQTGPGRTLSTVSEKALEPLDVTAEVARVAGVSYTTASKGIQILKASTPEEIKSAVHSGDLSITAGHDGVRALNRMPETRRAEVLERFGADPKSDIRRAIGEVKLAAKRELAEEIRANPIVTPDGRYQVIVSDPPWKYDTRAEDTSHRGKNQYPDMTTEEICGLPVASLAQDDCILWLWTTNAFMRDAYRCLDAWGFREKTILTWDKELIGLGDWLRNVTEHCILAVKGQPVVSLTNQTTIIREKRREHSRKPLAFYEMVEALCPGSKLEMFARTPRDGWASWGAETEKFHAA